MGRGTGQGWCEERVLLSDLSWAEDLEGEQGRI